MRVKEIDFFERSFNADFWGRIFDAFKISMPILLFFYR